MTGNITPETDALVPQFLNGGEIPDIFAHCRKLERERDEAREAIRALAEHGESEIQRITKERDEAMEKMADALQEVDLRTLDFDRMKQERDEAITRRMETIMQCELYEQERDEAREALQEIANASHFDNIGNWARNKARKALEEAK